MPVHRALPTAFATLCRSYGCMSDLKLKYQQQQAIHAVYNGMTLFFAKFWPCLFVIKSFLSFFDDRNGLLMVRRDVEPGSLPTLHMVFIRECWLSLVIVYTSFVLSLV